ncbi:hypothetical protein J5N97_023004 [Dioscorea zingiberensis]|uniref:Cytochrome P450 n=1 Tax=Dioscorea zingiberensis TaxID=325984 RepID=A0A9D5HBD4_9LILI|nr:hypothetical protein J5N97_023004 [Dioscorea zingiberensis]
MHFVFNSSFISFTTTTMNSSNQTSISGFGKYTGYRWPILEIQTIEFLLAVVIFVTIHALRQGKRKGLAVWPVLRMLPSLCLGLQQDVYEWITGVLHSQGGTFFFLGPMFTSLDCVITADPRNLEHLLKTKFNSFPKGPYFQRIMRDLLGNGIFSADDEVWRQQRKTASLEFHSTAFRTMTAESLVELVHSRLLPILDSCNESSLDLQDVLLRLTFDNVCMIAFGIDPGCLRPGLPEIPFARAFEDATEATVLRFVTPTGVWKTMRFLDLGSERTLKRSLKRVDEFAYQVIRIRKKELSMELEFSEKMKKRSDLLSVFMSLKDDNGDSFSDEFLRDICVNFILAGRDNTSVARAWNIWLLNMNPEVEERVVEELRMIVKERGVGGEDGEMVFRPEEVKKMEYLQAALSEALRLYPSVPVDHKQASEDEVLPDGTVMKKGTRIIYAIYTMGRMESIWGKDCREFKPERWLRDSQFSSESAYKFAAFNGGPRLCLGKDFAYYQMKFVAASILHRYRVKVVDGHPVTPKLALTMYMKHGLKVTLSKRDDETLG